MNIIDVLWLHDIHHEADNEMILEQAEHFSSQISSKRAFKRVPSTTKYELWSGLSTDVIGDPISQYKELINSVVAITWFHFFYPDRTWHKQNIIVTNLWHICSQYRDTRRDLWDKALPVSSLGVECRLDSDVCQYRVDPFDWWRQRDIQCNSHVQYIVQHASGRTVTCR